MNRRQREFADAQAAEFERDGDILIYIAARKQGASAEHAAWLLRDYKEKAREQASKSS